MSFDISLGMGGYGAFIWPAYGISVLGLGLAVALTLKGWRDAQARLARLERRRAEADTGPAETAP